MVMVELMMMENIKGLVALDLCSAQNSEFRLGSYNGPVLSVLRA